MLKFVNPLYLQIVVALLLCTNIPQLFQSKAKLKQSEQPYPRYVLSLIGFAAGFVSGVTGAIGLLFNKFYLRYGLTKEQIIATRAVNEIFLHFVKLVVYVLLGLYSQRGMYLGLIVALGSICSVYAIKYMLPYISEFFFKKVGYIAMVISGIFLLFSTVQKVISKDHIHLVNQIRGNKTETTVAWRDSEITLEYSWNSTLEVELAIPSGELPIPLLEKYQYYSKKYDRILIEKVYGFRKPVAYEFYFFDRKGKFVEKKEF